MDLKIELAHLSNLDLMIVDEINILVEFWQDVMLTAIFTNVYQPIINEIEN